MLTPQVNSPPTEVGLGFDLNEMDGKTWISQHGEIYRFNSYIEFIPAEKVGVVVIGSKDSASTVVSPISDFALSSMRKAKKGVPLPTIKKTSRLKREELHARVERIVSRDKDLISLPGANRLWQFTLDAGHRAEIRSDGKDLISDDLMEHGWNYKRAGENLLYLDDEFVKVKQQPPAPASN